MRGRWHRRGWGWQRPRSRGRQGFLYHPHSAFWIAQLACFFALSFSVTLCWPGQSRAQERLGVDPPRRPGPAEPSFPSPEEPPAIQQPVLPPLPPVLPQRQQQLPRLFVQQIRMTSNTVFSAEDLATVTDAYVHRYVTSEELEALRLALTRKYINAGYINSGAILPDQTVTEGVITFQIIEGALTDVLVTGNRYFREPYLRQRLVLGIAPPLKIEALQERLQILQQDERIARLEAELRPGVRLGESALSVQVVERLPFLVALEFNNYQSPSVGAERGLITVAHRNLTGHGDTLSVTYGRAAGLDLQLDASYTLPLTARDTALSLRYRRNDSSVVEEHFIPLDIESRSEVFTLGLRHPFYRTLQREFALALQAERLQSQTLLEGEGFAFALGADNGVATDTAVRLVAEWLSRTPGQVLALRSRFSVGIDVLGATRHADTDIPDGRFFAWLGQAQWGRRLPWWDMQLLARLDLQLTNDPLLPLEQMAIGGRFSVRGYRENQLVRDNGLSASLEARLPLIQHRRWAEFVQLVPFVDVGRGWNRNGDTTDPETLASIGLGVRWAATWQAAIPLHAQLEVFWGYQLKSVKTEGGDLQDHGLHLQFVLAAF